MDYEKIGKFIQARRKELGITQKELAEQLKVTNKAVSRWETGQGCPDVSLLGELSELLKVGIGELLNGEYNEKLTDNDKLILNAVNYSKEITAKKIYKKVSNIIYLILCCISSMFIVNMIGQAYYFKTEIQQVDVKENNLRERITTVAEKASKIAASDEFKKEEIGIIISAKDCLVNALEKLLSYQEDDRIIMHQEEINNLYYQNRTLYSWTNGIYMIAEQHDNSIDSHMSIYKLAFANNIEGMDNTFYDNNLKIWRNNLYREKTNFKLSNYISYLEDVLDRYEIGMEILLEVGEIYE